MVTVVVVVGWEVLVIYEREEKELLTPGLVEVDVLVTVAVGVVTTQEQAEEIAGG